MTKGVGRHAGFGTDKAEIKISRWVKPVVRLPRLNGIEDVE